jgi:uncharacterized protein (DUF983 family)
MVLVERVLKCKCPNCKSGDMFETKGNIFLLKTPKMYVRCKECDYKFEKEPGFFIGAMYVSYALGVSEIVGCLIILWGILDVSASLMVTVLVTLIILTSFFKYRLSRSIWMYLFY